MIVSAPGGAVYPLGGIVGNLNQITHHQNPANELKHGELVEITKPLSLPVTTWGKHIDGQAVSVVQVKNKSGFYLASFFRPAEPQVQLAG